MSKCTIRQGIWETNSSSMHAIAISNTPLDWDEINKRYKPIHFKHGEFGWEKRYYGTVDEKASYLYQAIWDCYYETPYSDKQHNKVARKERTKIINWIYDTLGKRGIAAVFDTNDFDQYGWPIGSIDHGYETVDFVKYVTSSEKHLLQYLFGSGAVYTSNDNTGMEDYVEFINTHKKDCRVFVKGN